MSFSKYILNPKLTQIKRYANYVNTTAYHKIVSQLSKDFPNANWKFLAEPLALEVADFFASLEDEIIDRDGDLDDVISYLEMTQDYLNTRKTKYSLKKAETIKAYEHLRFLQKHHGKPDYLTKGNRDLTVKTPEMVSEALEQARIQSNYLRTTSGYEFARNKLDTWLLKEVKETIKDLTNND